VSRQISHDTPTDCSRHTAWEAQR